MTHEEKLQEAVRAMRHERNCLRKLGEAIDAEDIARADYEAAQRVADEALADLDNEAIIPAYLSGEKK